MYSMYIEDVLFPVTPGKISYKIGNNNKTITLINEGEVNLIKTPGLTEITIDELILPVFQKYPFAQYEKDVFQNAEYFLGKLEEWKKSNKPVSFKLVKNVDLYDGQLGIINGTGIHVTEIIKDRRKHYYEIATNLETVFKYVTIEDYEIMEDVESYGLDIAVKLTMKEYRQWGIKKLVVKKSSKKASKKKTGKNSKSAAKTYKVKKGDTLLNIAKKQLGSSSRRKEIYKLNKSRIEQAAKKHGRKSSSNGLYLYKGTVLKLPK